MQVMLGREENRLESELNAYTRDESRLLQLSEGLQRLSDLNPPLDLIHVENGYRELRSKYEEEFKLYNVASVALSQVGVFLGKSLYGLAAHSFGVEGLFLHIAST